MKINRGDVINARFPHASGARGKKRPVVVVQADYLNGRLHHAVVAQLTTNLSDKADRACFLIEAGTAEGIAAGITKDSLFCGYLLSLMSEDRLQDIVGAVKLPLLLGPQRFDRLNHCLQIVGFDFVSFGGRDSNASVWTARLTYRDH